MMRSFGAAVAVLTLLAGCGDDGTQTPSGTTDAGSSGEAPSTSGGGTTSADTTASSTDPTSSTTAVASTGSLESSTSGVSTGDTEPGSSSTSSGGDAGLGELMGACGVLEAMDLTGDQPGFITNTLDFGDTGFDYDLLTPGGQQIFDEGNLGGSSLYSEVVAYEVLARCEDAMLLKTEAEIVYDAKGPRTDLLVEFDGTKIGVSVTRAQGFPLDDPYTVEQAQAILEDKLGDIPLSSAAVSADDAWEKQILHLVAYGPMHAKSLQTAYEALDPSYTLDTIVVVTVTEGDDLFIYTE